MTAAPGPHNALTDVAGLRVGSAHDAVVRTGVTVVRPLHRMVCAVDVRGGGPGTRETDALAPGTLGDAVDALVLSGGSVYGLAAADGVVAALGARGEGFALMDAPGVPRSPVVPAAILYDLANAGDKRWGEEPPYRALGAAALAAAGEEVALGRVGAGYGAWAGGTLGGLGSASAIAGDGLTVGALVAVNCFGSVRMPGSDAFWAWPFEVAGEFGGVRPGPDWPTGAAHWGAAKVDPTPRANTTLAVVACDLALTPAEAQRLAVMAQDGLARAIRPVHAPFDGDVVFALASGARDAPDEPLARAMMLARAGAMAADTLARAVARGVWEAERQAQTQS